MKKFFTLLVLAACCAAMTWGCSDYGPGIQMYKRV